MRHSIRPFGLVTALVILLVTASGSAASRQPAFTRVGAFRTVDGDTIAFQVLNLDKDNTVKVAAITVAAGKPAGDFGTPRSMLLVRDDWTKFLSIWGAVRAGHAGKDGVAGSVKFKDEDGQETELKLIDLSNQITFWIGDSKGFSIFLVAKENYAAVDGFIKKINDYFARPPALRASPRR